MDRFFSSIAVTTGFAIFSMLFGAGNLMYPIKVGIEGGSLNIYAISGFILTAICLPIAGLTSVILFDGDYNCFFNRLGRIPGFMATLFCILVLGPLIAMPRIVTLSYTMMSPFMPNISVVTFSVLFLFLAFWGSFKESKIIDLLGYVISPLLLISLIIIIFLGIFNPDGVTPAKLPSDKLFFSNLSYGFNTLDLVATIFFSAIVVQILKLKLNIKINDSLKDKTKILTMLGFKAGLIGTVLLGLVYVGMSYLGVFHGHGLQHLREGDVFSTISFRILGPKGALVISTAVLMACFSTIIALSAIVSKYIQKTVLQDKCNYQMSLIIVLLLTLIPANYGLNKILEFSIPIIKIGYPVIIVITFCNLAYKLFSFKPIKIPVIITLICSFLYYYHIL